MMSRQIKEELFVCAALHTYQTNRSAGEINILFLCGILKKKSWEASLTPSSYSFYKYLGTAFPCPSLDEKC